MKKTSKTETLRGKVLQLLFSPKGVIEGMLLRVRDDTVQVSTPPGALDARVKDLGVGALVALKAAPDHSPKTRQSPHRVYKLEAITQIAGKAVRGRGEGADGRIEGVVAALHYARHGEPNGVILESGEFLHLRPHGMERAGLQVGAKVVAEGERRMTVLGTTLLEARRVNRHKID